MSMLTLKQVTQRHLSDKSAFTLLEVIIAVAIMGTALVVLLGSVNRNLDISIQSRNLQIASTMAESIMTRVELEGFPNIREESGEFEYAPGFEWYLSVSPYNLQMLQTNLRLVRVVIIWNEGNDSLEIFSAISES